MPSKLEQLQQLQAQIPVLNQKAKDQADAARAIMLQQAVKAAPVGTQPVQAAQQLAPAMVEQQSKEQQAQTAQAAGQLQGAQGLALQETGLQGQRQQAETALSMSADLANRKADLTKLGSDIEGKLFRSRMAFAEDELGRKFSNERQLADWTLANARTEQEFQTRMQTLANEEQKAALVLKIANQKITDALERGWLTKEAALDFEAKKELAAIQAKMQEEIRKKEAKAKNAMAMGSSLGTLAGMGVAAAVVGTVATGGLTSPLLLPAMAAGGGIGGATGTIGVASGGLKL